MATAGKNLSQYSKEEILNSADFKIGIVVSIWNDAITSNLLSGAIEALKDNGVLDENIIIKQVPGAFELPLGSQYLLSDASIDGVIAIGVGFALQNALANMTSGIFILYYKPFFIGDYVSFESVESNDITEGKIMSINLRITTLEFQGHKILVPNHILYSAVVTVKATK